MKPAAYVHTSPDGLRSLASMHPNIPVDDAARKVGWTVRPTFFQADVPSTCDTCNGSGLQPAGYSGLESDGNAPLIEPCGECGYAEAPSKPVAMINSQGFVEVLADYCDAYVSINNISRPSFVKLIGYFDAHTARAVAEAIAPLKRQNLELARVNAQQRLQEQRLEIALARANKLGVR